MFRWGGGWRGDLWHFCVAMFTCIVIPLENVTTHNVKNMKCHMSWRCLSVQVPRAGGLGPGVLLEEG